MVAALRPLNFELGSVRVKFLPLFLRPEIPLCELGTNECIGSKVHDKGTSESRCLIIRHMSLKKERRMYGPDMPTQEYIRKSAETRPLGQ